MHLYDQIKSHFQLPDAYSDWKEYRNFLTNYLLEQTNEISVPLTFHANMNISGMLPTLAILGAGACNDLDLSRLISNFSTITLIDYDESCMQQALRTYRLEGESRIQYKPLSLNGIQESDYREFCEELQFHLRENTTHITPEAFESFALSLVKQYYQKNRQHTIPLVPASYDYLWCFGVHSQLQAMFSYIYHAFEVNLAENLFSGQPYKSEQYYNYLRSENTRFIPLFHDAMFSCAKKAVFLGLEKSRLNSTNVIEGSAQACADISSRNLLFTKDHTVWPFYPAGNIAYHMDIFKIDASSFSA